MYDDWHLGRSTFPMRGQEGLVWAMHALQVAINLPHEGSGAAAGIWSLT